jgi:hypothetical protein
MGEYRCLNCDHTTSSPNVLADICRNTGCGFRVGRYVWDDDAGSSYSSSPRSQPTPPSTVLGVSVAAGTAASLALWYTETHQNPSTLNLEYPAFCLAVLVTLLGIPIAAFYFLAWLYLLATKRD